MINPQQTEKMTEGVGKDSEAGQNQDDLPQMMVALLLATPTEIETMREEHRQNQNSAKKSKSTAKIKVRLPSILILRFAVRLEDLLERS
jgi:hypothetical protein